jgi:DNA primase
VNPFHERIRAKVDLLALVSEHVDLTPQSSTDHWGLCPLHPCAKRTASFHVVPQRGLFKCFDCGEGGDVFRFVEAVEGVSFSRAVAILAHRAGLDPESSA